MNKVTPIIASGLLALSACRSVPPGAIEPQDPHESLQPALAWSAESDTESLPVDEAFWESFGSPVLNRLVQEGLAASPTLAIAASRVRASAATLRAAGGAKLPTLQASLGSSRSRLNFVGLPVPGTDGVLTSQTTSHSLSLATSWEIDLWGRLASAERAAAANLDALGLDLVAARQSLAAQITKALFALAESHGNQESARTALANAEDVLASVQRRLLNGSAASQELLSAEAAVANAKRGLTASAQRSSALQAPLMVLLGRPAGKASGLRGDELSELVVNLRAADLPRPPAAGLPAEILGRRPDLAAQEARVNAAQANAEVAHAMLFPSFSLTGSVGSSGTELKNLLDGDFQVWSIGANLLAPLFNGGQLKAQELRAIEERDSALFGFAAAALVAFAEVDVALSGEAFLRKRLSESKVWRDKLAQNEGLLQSKNQRGSAMSGQVFTARSQRIAADVELLTLIRELYTNRVDLYLALGGGFDSLESGETDQ